MDCQSKKSTCVRQKSQKVNWNIRQNVKWTVRQKGHLNCQSKRSTGLSVKKVTWMVSQKCQLNCQSKRSTGLLVKKAGWYKYTKHRIYYLTNYFLTWTKYFAVSNEKLDILIPLFIINVYNWLASTHNSLLQDKHVDFRSCPTISDKWHTSCVIFQVNMLIS